MTPYDKFNIDLESIFDEYKTKFDLCYKLQISCTSVEDLAAIKTSIANLAKNFYGKLIDLFKNIIGAITSTFHTTRDKFVTLLAPPSTDPSRLSPLKFLSSFTLSPKLNVWYDLYGLCKVMNEFNEKYYPSYLKKITDSDMEPVLKEYDDIKNKIFSYSKKAREPRQMKVKDLYNSAVQLYQTADYYPMMFSYLNRIITKLTEDCKSIDQHIQKFKKFSTIKEVNDYFRDSCRYIQHLFFYLNHEWCYGNYLPSVTHIAYNAKEFERNLDCFKRMLKIIIKCAETGSVVYQKNVDVLCDMFKTYEATNACVHMFEPIPENIIQELSQHFGGKLEAKNILFTSISPDTWRKIIPDNGVLCGYTYSFGDTSDIRTVWVNANLLFKSEANDKLIAKLSPDGTYLGQCIETITHELRHCYDAQQGRVFDHKTDYINRWQEVYARNYALNFVPSTSFKNWVQGILDKLNKLNEKTSKISKEALDATDNLEIAENDPIKNAEKILKFKLGSITKKMFNSNLDISFGGYKKISLNQGIKLTLNVLQKDTRLPKKTLKMLFIARKDQNTGLIVDRDDWVYVYSTTDEHSIVPTNFKLSKILVE